MGFKRHIMICVQCSTIPYTNDGSGISWKSIFNNASKRILWSDETLQKIIIVYYISDSTTLAFGKIWKWIFNHLSSRHFNVLGEIVHIISILCTGLGVMVMVLNAPFNNISVISFRTVLLLEETGVPEENHRSDASLTNFIT